MSGTETMAHAITVHLKTEIGENFNGPEAMIEALAARACDYVMPDAARIGGVSGWIQAAGIAAAHGIEMSSHLLPEISRAPARREPDLPLPGICRLGRRDPRGAAADPGWPRTRSGPSGHRTHVEIGSREGPVAGSLISHLASAIPRCPSRLRERPDLLHARRPCRLLIPRSTICAPGRLAASPSLLL